MCPVCVATVTIYLAGTASTGGLSALVARNLRRRNNAKTTTLHEVQGKSLITKNNLEGE
jgi:hypothetical protein